MDELDVLPEMISPYEPPKATESQAPLPRLTLILRWIGVLCFGYLIARFISSDFITPAIKVANVVLNSMLAIGILRLGRRFCLSVAIFLLITICVQGYYTWMAIANPQSIHGHIPDGPWLVFAISIIPHSIIFVSTSILFYRLPRGIQEAEQAVAPNGP